jgi:hypothetical protein
MSLKLADIQEWLQAAFPATPVQLNRLQDTPDEAIAINIQGGPQILEGYFEESYLIVRCRAAADHDDVAEALALAVHAFMCANEFSQTIGTTYMVSLFPSAGPPTYSGWDVDRRSIYQGSYQLKVAT